MNDDKTSDLINQTFSRFLISGLVFYLFIILLPFTMYFKLGTYVYDPVFIILFSIIIGLLLDLSKFYRFSWRIIGIKKIHLENHIVEAFNIYINRGNENNNYKKRIAEIARQIHEIYIRTNHPKIYHRIKEARVYPDILSMAFLSILLFIAIEVIFSIFFIFYIWYYESSPLNAFEISPFSPFRKMLIIILNVSLIFVLVKGKVKIGHIYRLTTDFTKSIISEAYYNNHSKAKKEILSIIGKGFNRFRKRKRYLENQRK